MNAKFIFIVKDTKIIHGRNGKLMSMVETILFREDGEKTILHDVIPKAILTGWRHIPAGRALDVSISSQLSVAFSRPRLL